MDTGLWDSGQSTMARNQDVGRGIITRDEESKVIQYPFLYEGIIQSQPVLAGRQKLVGVPP